MNSHFELDFHFVWPGSVNGDSVKPNLQFGWDTEAEKSMETVPWA